jgi:hypothetical protein
MVTTAVVITASTEGDPGKAHVSCSACWIGVEVPKDEALAVAAEHEASAQHLEEELASLWFELLAERVSVERGH